MRYRNYLSSINMDSSSKPTTNPIVDILLSSIEKNLQNSGYLSNSSDISKHLNGVLTGAMNFQLQQSLANMENRIKINESLNLVGTLSMPSKKVSRNVSSAESNQTTSMKSSIRGHSARKSPSASTQSISNYANNTDLGPIMIIHVCDEAKKIKKDFTCPRQALISEMKYFSEYLSSADTQRPDDVDISVHCDVTIFEWLMNYVKRNIDKTTDHVSNLDPSNVISILISSDFLQMDSLVNECITFCQANLELILAAPTNMNSIKQELVNRIADGLSHNNLDSLKDKRDKIKSKLFMHKIASLFDDTPNSDSPEIATTLFRCINCKRLLTKSVESRIPCCITSVAISNRGNLSYSHNKDPDWNVNDFISDWRNKNVKTDWRHLYWKLWGVINCLHCSRCGSTFQCKELNSCRYHSQSPIYRENGLFWECCKKQSSRLDAWSISNGCEIRDHIVDTLEVASGSSTVTMPLKTNSVYNDLLSHRSLICTDNNEIDQTYLDIKLNVFGDDEAAFNAAEKGQTHSLKNEKLTTTSLSISPPKLQALHKVENGSLTSEDMTRINYANDITDEDEDEDVADEDYEDSIKVKKVRKVTTVNPEAILIDPPTFAPLKSTKWDSTRSVRWNQDAQREDDQRRTENIITYLARLRTSCDKSEKQKHKTFNGGIFSRLDSVWKGSYVVQTPTSRTTIQQLNRNKQPRNILQRI